MMHKIRLQSSFNKKKIKKKPAENGSTVQIIGKLFICAYVSLDLQGKLVINILKVTRYLSLQEPYLAFLRFCPNPIPFNQTVSQHTPTQDEGVFINNCR